MSALVNEITSTLKIELKEKDWVGVLKAEILLGKKSYWALKAEKDW